MGQQCTTCNACNGENEFNDVDPRSSIAIQQSKGYTSKTNSKMVILSISNVNIELRHALQIKFEEDH